MKTLRFRLPFLILAFFAITGCNTQAQKAKPEKIIFAFGGGLNKTFINYVAQLTNKDDPSICFVPTASADNRRSIQDWFEGTSDMKLKPFVLKTFISSYQQEESFEEILLNMDAIIVGGGNTLNMMAIWEAQGIDTVLRKAYEKGIVLAGGSAGSLCWFESGTTDSRPKKLTTVECLGFLPYSHSPHYSSEKSRRPAYHKNILTGILADGYAIDNLAGIVFKDGKVDHVVQMDDRNNAYFVYKKDGEIIEELLEAKIIKTIK
jgi:peptidase E